MSRVSNRCSYGNLHVAPHAPACVLATYNRLRVQPTDSWLLFPAIFDMLDPGCELEKFQEELRMTGRTRPDSPKILAQTPIIQRETS